MTHWAYRIQGATVADQNVIGWMVSILFGSLQKSFIFIKVLTVAQAQIVYLVWKETCRIFRCQMVKLHLKIQYSLFHVTEIFLENSPSLLDIRSEAHVSSCTWYSLLPWLLPSIQFWDPLKGRVNSYSLFYKITIGFASFEFTDL